MKPASNLSAANVARDLTAGLVVSLVALPLCLGVALASNAPLSSGVLAGVVGGVLVGVLSGSQTSVSGPAAGLTAVVAAQAASLGSFQAFLLALVVGGLLQIGLGITKIGVFASFVPSSVIKGLLAAVGVVLVLKQIPHVLGHDLDPEGDASFLQADNQNTFSELLQSLGDVHSGAAMIGLLSIAALIIWDRWKPLKRSALPAPLIVVLFGVAISHLFGELGGQWALGSGRLLKIADGDGLAGFLGMLQAPDLSQWSNPAVYRAAVTIAAVASLETLLNLEAVDKIDPQQRTSPPSRELIAQGIANVALGLIGGLPVTSVVVRSSVNINAGARTRLATVVQGVLLLVGVLLLPVWLNKIPLSCLAAILLVAGAKLASPSLVKQMWNEGRRQFLLFAMTVAAVVFTDLLIGVLLGFVVSISFILWSNARRPIRRVMEKHLGGDVLHIELANQASFLNRVALNRTLNALPRGGHVLLDARNTDYIDPDILDLLRDFAEKKGPARGVEVSLTGFQSKYELKDHIQYMDYSTRELQNALTPQHVLQILKDGNERFRTGRRLTRDIARQMSATADGQHPLAVILSCIDSRAPAELIFDMGLGEILSVRIAGNVTGKKVLGSLEFSCAVAGAKLVLVVGHTRCGAVTAAVDLLCLSKTSADSMGCDHLEPIVHEIQQAIDPASCEGYEKLTATERQAFVDMVAKRNVSQAVELMLKQSTALRSLVDEGRIAIVGAMYNIATGDMEYLETAGDSQAPDAGGD